jgi:argininosuccinate lyase
MKLWQKKSEMNKQIEKFTVGSDRELDLLLAGYDILGSLAHIAMLHKIGLLNSEEHKQLNTELKAIYSKIESGTFRIDEGVEDVHSQVEFLLTQKLGDTGKKIHSARSRNDQILLDIKLFTRHNLLLISESISQLFETLITLSEKYKSDLMPGYTHLQIAMPSSFGLWFGAYAESLTDDLMLIQTAFRITNQNPLGSAAGYGTSFPIDRQLTTDLLGFESMNYNVIYAQMGRGKVERTVAFALGSVASTISKMAYDCCLFMSQNFGFISLPDELTTGSSIMPHKKNPDVFELLRAKCNKITALANEITLISINLPSGYFRDFQVIKETYLESFGLLRECLEIAKYTIRNILINKNILEDEKYKYIFSVEDVNREVLKGVPFRKAYNSTGEKIRRGEFQPNKIIDHTHEGSIGNLCNDKIKNKFTAILSGFNRERFEQAESELLK